MPPLCGQEERGFWEARAFHLARVAGLAHRDAVALQARPKVRGADHLVQLVPVRVPGVAQRLRYQSFAQTDGRYLVVHHALVVAQPHAAVLIQVRITGRAHYTSAVTGISGFRPGSEIPEEHGVQGDVTRAFQAVVQLATFAVPWPSVRWASIQ